MKFVNTSIALLLLLSVTSAHSQDISLHYQYAPLDTIVNAIKKQTGLTCTLTVANKKIDSLSLYVIERSLPEALSILLKGRPYHFDIYTNYFVIRDLAPGEIVKPANNAGPDEKTILGPPPADVRGTLVDATGKPVSGAIVQMLQSNVITKTDQQGKFILRMVPVEGGFEISHPQYLTQRYFNIGFTEIKPIVLEKK